MNLTSADILKTLDSHWLSQQSAPVSNDTLESFKGFSQNNHKRLTTEQKAIVTLTEAMLLKAGNRHIEADELIKANYKRFNRIDEPVYAHRWQRMQLVNELREGKSAEIYAAVEQLAAEAETYGWHNEHMRALTLQHLVELNMGLFKKAVESAALRLQLATAHNDLNNQREAVLNIAHTYQRFKHNKQALEELEKAKPLFTGDLNQPAHMHYYMLLAAVYQVSGTTDKAVVIYKDILNFLKESGVEDTSIYFGASCNMAAAYLEKGKYPEAEKQYLLLQEYVVKHNWAIHRLDIAVQLCNVYYDWNKYEKMSAVLKTAEKLLKEIKHPHLEVSLLNWRAKYEKAVGNTALALACFEEYHRRYAEWKAIDDAEKIKALELKHDLQQEQLKQELMKKENQLQHQELQMLNSFIIQKDKLINEFALHYKELEATGLKRKAIFERLNEMVRSVEFSSREERETYNVRFNQAHLAMVSTLQKRYPKLSNTEAKVAVMLTQGLSNKEISGLTLTTVRNIEAARLRMRKKMDLTRNDDLLKKIREATE